MSNEKELAKKYQVLQKDPFKFIELMWGLKSQEYVAGTANSDINTYSDLETETFKKGKHITKHQTELIQSVKDGVNDKGKRRITVRAGRGVGKTSCLSWIILWFLFCYKDAQVPCTAPTVPQMHDALWKELALWLQLMPKVVQAKYDWTKGYLRITERPDVWFARARTGKKEDPEALAGIHSEHVLLVADEASGIPNEVYHVAEGTLTDDNVLMILISNPRRLIGYFYDSHKKGNKLWKQLHFNGEDSPLVKESSELIQGIKADEGDNYKQSDRYRIEVLGEFPKAESLDEKGYVPLFIEQDIRKTDDDKLFGTQRIGIDPAGEGKDETVWVIRDRLKAKVLAKEKISNSKSIVQKTLTLMEMTGVEPANIYIDNFGVGANVAQELALAGHRTNPVNVGTKAQDDSRYLNLRAESYWRVREWMRTGGELVIHKAWEELLTIRYRAELNGKLRIMDKLTMKKEGYGSPDYADALMLTFTKPDVIRTNKMRRHNKVERKGVNKIGGYA